jgi:hypothetical protein
MTPDDMEARTLALAAWLDSSTHEPCAFSSAQAASDLRALLLDYQERGRALERLREDVRYLRNMVGQTQSDICPVDPAEMEKALAAIAARATLKGKSQ